jgi:hypothetical protein
MSHGSSATLALHIYNYVGSPPAQSINPLFIEAVNNLHDPGKKAHILRSENNWNMRFPDPRDPHNFSEIALIILAALDKGLHRALGNAHIAVHQAGELLIGVTYEIINGAINITDAWVRGSTSDFDALFSELANNGAKFNKEETLWIVRRPNGQISWLETGTLESGFNHILIEHPVSQFSSFGVTSEAELSFFIKNAVSTMTPVGYYKDGLVYSHGNQGYLRILYSDKGYIVTAHKISDNITFF